MAKLPPPPPGFDVVPENKEGASRFAQPNLAAEPPPPPGYEPVDTRGWGEWAYDTVVGREDPRYKGLPTVDEALTAEGKRQGKFFTGPEQRQIRGSIPFAVTDEQYRDVMKNALGERFLGQETDKYGNHVVVYRGDDGHEKRAYVNRPGLDSEDISRGLVQSVPYVVGGVGAGLAKLGLGARAALQGITGAGISAGQDKAAEKFGSEQGIDPLRAAVTGFAGMAGEVASPVVASMWRRFVTEPGLYDAVTQQLTPKGMTIAIEAGIDPSAIKGKLAQEFAKTYAKTGDAAIASNQFAQSDLGIESTIGQRTKHWDKLFEEEKMRKGLKGEQARKVMEEFDARQRAQIGNAIIGNPDANGAANIPGEQGLAASINPSRSVREMGPRELGAPIQEGLQTARQNAKAVESEAWRDLRGITAEQQALDEFLPQFVAPAIREGGVDPQLTPNAYRMVDLLRQYQSGHLAQDEVLSHFGANTQRPTVDEIRRRLLAYMDNAAPGSPDKRAASQLYRAYDDWLGASADAHLLSGHPDAAMAIRQARGISREIKDLLQPRGNEKAAGNIISRAMDKADSPEAVINSIVGKGVESNLPIGSVGAMERMKTLLTTHGGSEGMDVWNDVRTAYLMRAVKDKKGELRNPTALLSTMQTMFEKQSSLLRVLYSPQEIGQMRKFMRSLEQITYKPPNPSGSAYGVIQGVKDLVGTLLSAIPGAEKLKVPLHVAWKLSGVPSAQEIMARRAAEQAIKQGGIPGAIPPSLAGISAAAENLYRGQRDQ